MAKYYGAIGFGKKVEGPRGVFKDVIIERFYFGDVQADTRKLEEGEYLNKDLSVLNVLSIVADAFALEDENYFAMRYASWAGTLFTVSSVKVERPRLILRLGGVYNGPTPTAP